VAHRVAPDPHADARVAIFGECAEADPRSQLHARTDGHHAMGAQFRRHLLQYVGLGDPPTQVIRSVHVRHSHMFNELRSYRRPPLRGAKQANGCGGA
jgi:hypothetical protein